MQLLALISLLPLLTPTLALPNHDASLAQRNYRQEHHRRVGVSAVSPNKVKVKRKVSRRAGGVCKNRDGSLGTIGGPASAPAPAPAASSVSSIAAGNLAAKPSSAAATPSPAGTTPAPSDDSLSIWSSAAASASAAFGSASAPSAAVTSSPSSAAAPASSSAAPTSAASNGTTNNGSGNVAGKAALTPGGKKAGITLCNSIDEFVGHISWCYDWTPSPSPPSGVIGASMLWGDGSLGADQDDAQRLAAFKALTTSPAYVIGPEEPDCSTPGSAAMSVDATATLWNTVIAPHGSQGSVLLSPSMCHQYDENFLTPFEAKINVPWDVTNLHINKIDMAGVKKDLDYYWNTYKKPMWVTEFACVEDQSWTPSTDQNQINQFIHDIVDLFENDDRVYAYAYSNGIGLGNVWPAIVNGQITESGKAYLSAISKYH